MLCKRNSQFHFYNTFITSLISLLFGIIGGGGVVVVVVVVVGIWRTEAVVLRTDRPINVIMQRNSRREMVLRLIYQYIVCENMLAGRYKVLLPLFFKFLLLLLLLLLLFQIERNEKGFVIVVRRPALFHAVLVYSCF